MKVDCGYTENYLKEKNRMTKNCKISCESCPISNDNNKTDLPCEEFEATYPDKTNGCRKSVQKRASKSRKIPKRSQTKKYTESMILRQTAKTRSYY